MVDRRTATGILFGLAAGAAILSIPTQCHGQTLPQPEANSAPAANDGDAPNNSDLQQISSIEEVDLARFHFIGAVPDYAVTITAAPPVNNGSAGFGERNLVQQPAIRGVHLSALFADRMTGQPVIKNCEELEHDSRALVLLVAGTSNPVEKKVFSDQLLQFQNAGDRLCPGFSGPRI